MLISISSSHLDYLRHDSQGRGFALIQLRGIKFYQPMRTTNGVRLRSEEFFHSDMLRYTFSTNAT